MKALLLGGLSATAITAGVLTLSPEPAEAPVVHCDELDAEVVLVEQSASARSDQLQAERLGFVRSTLTSGAVCDYPVRVAAWSAAGTTRVIWSEGDHLGVPGGTEQARANRAAGRVEAAMQETVLPRWEAALAALPAEPSDVLAWPQLADDLFPAGADRVRISVLSDGVQADERLDLNRPLDDAAVQAALDQISVGEVLPDGVSVRILGVGRTAEASAPPSGAWNEGLRAFWAQQCEAVASVCVISGVVS